MRERPSIDHTSECEAAEAVPICPVLEARGTYWQGLTNGGALVAREEWLQSLVEEIGPWCGVDLPAIRISIGFPSGGKRSKSIGECWDKTCDEEGACHIFIHPKLSAEVEIAACVAHELIHATGIHGHKSDFKRLALLVGLQGPMTATTAGPLFTEKIEPVLKEIGPLPHSALNFLSVGGAKKQTTRLIKCECPDCGYTIRTTQKWIDVGLPLCPCTTEMAVV